MHNCPHDHAHRSDLPEMALDSLQAHSRRYFLGNAGYGLGMAAGLLTQLTPEELLAALRTLEEELGREPPRERWGPRVIDLDLLVVGREQRASDVLKLPHPGIAERDFVLYPLADIAPDLEVPGLGRVSRLRDAVADRGVRKL